MIDLAYNNNQPLELPLFVEFISEWCEFHSELQLLIKQLKQEYQAKVKFMSVNVDQNPALADKYNINLVPTFLIFSRDQKIIDRINGLESITRFRNKLDLATEDNNGN